MIGQYLSNKNESATVAKSDFFFGTKQGPSMIPKTGQTSFHNFLKHKNVLHHFIPLIELIEKYIWITLFWSSDELIVIFETFSMLTRKKTGQAGFYGPVQI
jgi:hypothetical protein